MPKMKVYFEIVETHALELDVPSEDMAEDFVTDRFNRDHEGLKLISVLRNTQLNDIRVYRLNKANDRLLLEGQEEQE